MTITVHGITFIREGMCRQCGACGCSGCPHHIVRDGKSVCLIYATRSQVCGQCSNAIGEPITHQSCIGFPDNPWITVIRDGTCSYQFRRADGGSMDDLPFLNGERYRTCQQS